jgi:hypothetical protein
MWKEMSFKSVKIHLGSIFEEAVPQETGLDIVSFEVQTLDHHVA